MASKRSKLLEDLEAPIIRQYSGPCKFALVVMQMDEEDKQGIERAIERVRNDLGQGKSKAYSSSWLTKMLRKNGYDISISTVQRHVNKECPCERTGQ